MGDKLLEAIQSLVQCATHFSSHSGEVGEGGVFVALKGASQDGHDFVSGLLKKNILAVIVERPVGIKDKRIIEVADSQKAHWQIASMFREKFKGAVVGIGGSNGKTSTKEFLYHILSKKFRCVKTEKSQNGLFGIPKTMEKLRSDVEIAIIEIGIDAPGDMARNVSLVRPSHAVLTSIGEEHLNLLKNLDGVFAEERILVDFTLKSGGKAYCPSSDSYLSTLSGAKLLPALLQDLNPKLKAIAQAPHVVQNLVLASAIALDLGMNEVEIQNALGSIKLLDGRGLPQQINDHLWILRDHYNANPSSMKVALASAAKFANEKALPLKLILGDMLDLGAISETAHQEIVREARTLGADCILWVGPKLLNAVKELGPASPENEFYLSNSADKLDSEIKSKFTDKAVVLVKGSRGTELEKTMDQLY